MEGKALMNKNPELVNSHFLDAAYQIWYRTQKSKMTFAEYISEELGHKKSSNKTAGSGANTDRYARTKRVGVRERRDTDWYVSGNIKSRGLCGGI